MDTKAEQLIVFTVPYLVPPSGNHYKKPTRYIGKDGSLHLGFKLTKEAKAYYDAAAIFARGRTVAPDEPADRKRASYAVRIDVYLPPRARGDFDNFFKCGLDALVHCGMIHSDAAVDGDRSNCVVHKNERTDPRTTYTIERLTP
jgi:Holliday junction resolvase RusA-like endonuclease